MGRLRSGKDADYFCRIAGEVTDLFGTDDAILYRYFGKEDENLTGKDPIWDEPTTTAFFESYPMPVQWFDYTTISNESEHGRDEETDATAFLTVAHLIAAGVPVDPDKQYVSVGDTLAIHTDCGHLKLEYDILQVRREGWVDSSDNFVGYSVELKRRDKYVPERKTST